MPISVPNFPPGCLNGDDLNAAMAALANAVNDLQATVDALSPGSTDLSNYTTLAAFNAHTGAVNPHVQHVKTSAVPIDRTAILHTAIGLTDGSGNAYPTYTPFPNGVVGGWVIKTDLTANAGNWALTGLTVSTVSVSGPINTNFRLWILGY